MKCKECKEEFNVLTQCSDGDFCVSCINKYQKIPSIGKRLEN